jgi:hypothetical protein
MEELGALILWKSIYPNPAMTQTFSSSGIYGLLSKIAHGLLLRTAL